MKVKWVGSEGRREDVILGCRKMLGESGERERRKEIIIQLSLLFLPPRFLLPPHYYYTTTTLPSLSPSMIRRLPLPRSLSRPLPLPLYRRLHLPALPPPSPPEDFDPLPPSFLNLTPSALSQIVRAQKKANNEDLALRIAVESGGCHGYQYKIEVTDERGEDD